MKHQSSQKTVSAFDQTNQQRGFTLIEMGLSLALATVVIASSLVWIHYQTRLDEARAAGQTFTRINAAVGTYLANYYSELMKLPVQCSTLDWKYSDTGNPAGQTATSYAGCNLALTLADGSAHNVANGMQPTLVDLQKLGVLDPNVKDVLPFPTRNGMIGTQGSTVQVVPPRYAVLIEQVCVASTNTVPSTNPSCPSNDKDLRSLVFNSQPYATDQFGGSFMGQTMLNTAFLVAGGDAAISGDMGTGQSPELEGLRGSFSAKNPLRKSVTDPQTQSSSSVGVANILAMRNGYGSSAFAQFMRKDGSTRPTGNWNFNGYTITNIQKLEAREIDTQSLKAEVATIDNLKANKTLSNTLEVNNKLLLQQIRTAGSACDSTTEGIAMSADRASLMICSPQTHQWSLMKASNTITYDTRYFHDRDWHDTGWRCTEWSRPWISSYRADVTTKWESPRFNVNCDAKTQTWWTQMAHNTSNMEGDWMALKL